MIKADHKKWADYIFKKYMIRLLKKNFSNFYLCNELPYFKDNESILFTPNHISWWDGFFMGFLNYKFFKKKFHIMMLERQLLKYNFFKKVGAYSIDPSNRNSVNETLSYTHNILTQDNNMAVMYPQGRIIQQGDKYSLKKGITHIRQNDSHGSNDFNVIIPAFRINYFEKKLPEIWVNFSNTIPIPIIENNFQKYEKLFNKTLLDLNQSCFDRAHKRDLFSD